MSTLLREDILTWLGTLFLAVSTALAGWTIFRGKGPQQRVAGLARWGTGIGGYLLLLALIARGLQAGGWPLTSTYEALLLAAAAMALASIVVAPRRLAALGGGCAGLTATLMVVLGQLLIPAVARVPHVPPPALGGIWFPLHVLVTAVGYGGLLLSGSAGVLRLLSRRGVGGGSLHRSTVTSADLEVLAWRSLSWGYPWLTLGMLLGAVWGWQTWGRYWSWSVKEVLTLLTWGLFTLAFHARRLKGWRGRPYAAVLVAGLVALLMTLLAAGVLVRQGNPAVQYIF